MLSTILLDIDVLVKLHNKKLDNLLMAIHYSPSYHLDDKDSMLGVILVVPKEIKEKTMRDEKRILSLSDDDIGKITFFSYFIYNRKKGLCEILNYRTEFIEHILDAIATGFTEETIIWIFAPIYQKVLNYRPFVACGFTNPHITSRSPSGRQFKSEMMCMTRKNSIFENTGDINDFAYVLKNTGNDICSVKIRFSEKAIQYLKKLPEIGFEFNRSGISTQRELSGKFKVSNKGNYFSVNIDNDNVKSGDETEVSNMTNRYNFHTHPREAYTKYRVEHGFPSSRDFASFLRCVKEFDAMFHVVISLEGLYVLSVSKNFMDKIEMVNDNTYDFIEKNYDAQRDVNDATDKYIDYINNIKYNGARIFDVTFVKWENLSRDINVSYTRSNLTCTTVDSLEHKKLFKF